MTQTRSALLATVVAAVVVTVMSACGGDDSASTSASTDPAELSPVTSASTTAAVTTTAVSPTTLVSTTVTGAGATTSPPTTTARPTTVPATTVPSGPPCDLALIVEQTRTAFAGVTATSLRCADEWASWAGSPDDPTAMDGYFAVAQWNGASWELRNLGTAGICGDGGVPAELWPALDCVD